MPIKITLRNDLAISKFRRNLLRLISSPKGNELIICSGYIWENSTGGYQISNDELGLTIQKNITGKITTIAGKFSFGYNYSHYLNFVNSLRINYGLNVQAKIAPKKNWHAKIALKIDKGIPIAGLIGSSNLTGPAYAEPPDTSRWNFECDTLIWVNDKQLNTHFNTYFSESQNQFGIFSTILDPDISQPEEGEQLLNIFNDLKNLEEFTEI